MILALMLYYAIFFLSAYLFADFISRFFDED